MLITMFQFLKRASRTVFGQDGERRSKNAQLREMRLHGSERDLLEGAQDCGAREVEGEDWSEGRTVQDMGDESLRAIHHCKQIIDQVV